MNRTIIKTTNKNTGNIRNNIRKIILPLFAFTLFVMAPLSEVSAAKKKGGPVLSVGPFGGFLNGAGAGVEFSATRLSSSYPFGLYMGVGYFSQQNSGVAVEARKIFINDATGGNDNIEKYGKTLYFMADLGYEFIAKSDIGLSAYAGARHARYKAHFNYQGGNEAFDVYNNSWGFGGGVRLALKLNSKLSFCLNTGVDYFFPAQLVGHGNFYDPEGIDDNPRNDYTYTDADNAINQPDTNAKVLVSFVVAL